MNTNLNGKALFVTGTDTSVGKTLVCALLLRYLRAQGVGVVYQKWVSTGDANQSEDLELCRRVAGAGIDGGRPELAVPYRFGLPASPHLAAEMEHRQVEPGPIRAAFQTLLTEAEMLLVEGVGGVLVPLRRDLLLADLLAELKLPTLVVARSGLGTLNHTFLTLEALRRRHLPILGVIFSDSQEEENEELVQDNLRTVEEMGQVKVFGRLRRQTGPELRPEMFEPVGKAVWEGFQGGRGGAAAKP